MNPRPSITPLALAAAVERLPQRFRRRLHDQPDIADAWQWIVGDEHSEIDASQAARVIIDGPRVNSLQQVSCSCLIAPRCLHIGAVLTRLPIDTDQPPLKEAVVTLTPVTDSVSLTAAQSSAVEQVWRAAIGLLEAGAQSAGLVLVSELLRGVHSCRLEGLHRLASAGIRVAQGVESLHAQRTEFRLEALAANLQDVLSTAHAMRSHPDAVPRTLIGIARRAYPEVGSLRLAGLFTEAIVSATGYAGVVTYVADQSGVIWSLADIAPGGPERCQFAYDSPIELGDVSLDHRVLARAGLYVQRATAAANRRLGFARSVSAVAADGFAWTAGPLAQLWETPLEVQLDRAWRRNDERPAGDDLLFMPCTVAGSQADALWLSVGSRRLRAVAPTVNTELAYQHNLRMLTAAPGLRLMAIGRIAFGRPRMVFLLAVGGDGLDLPREWKGRVNLGLDRLQAGHVRRARANGARGAEKLDEESAVVDPLDPLKRRLLQVLLGGRSVISQTTWSGFARDESALARNHLATGAVVLRRLRDAPLGDIDAEARRTRLALAWLAGRTYVDAAESRLQRLGWLGD